MGPTTTSPCPQWMFPALCGYGIKIRTISYPFLFSYIYICLCYHHI